MQCDWCQREFVENDRMMKLIVVATSAWVCYECALEWVSDQRVTLECDLDPDA